MFSLLSFIIFHSKYQVLNTSMYKQGPRLYFSHSYRLAALLEKGNTPTQQADASLSSFVSMLLCWTCDSWWTAGDSASLLLKWAIFFNLLSQRYNCLLHRLTHRGPHKYEVRKTAWVWSIPLCILSFADCLQWHNCQ